MRVVLSAFFAVLISLTPAFGATLTVVNLDGAGEGFNDPAPRAPVGGNPGVTLGAQRLIAFQYAADIWGGLLQSDVEIRIGANFDPLPCNMTSAVLGGAGAETTHRDFPNAPVANTWYPQALANSIAGIDLDAGSNDIFATFNSTIGTTCPLPSAWYYGLDATPVGTDSDFATVVLHELGHGLGFMTLVNLTTGAKSGGFDDTYMLNLEDHSTGLLYPAMSDGQRVAASIDTGDLHWTGTSVVASGAGLSAGRDPISGHVEMYAPNPAEPGSSVSHFSTSLSPNEVMEPAYTGALHDPSLALDLMFDIGWLAADCGNGILDAGEACDDGNTSSGDGCSACFIDECYSCVGAPSTCTPQTGPACDDGDACTTTDICQAGVCIGGAIPMTGCLVGAKASFQVSDSSDPSKDQIKWKLQKGDAFGQLDLGDPITTRAYSLCIYDETAGVPSLVASLTIDPNASWTDKAPKGFNYKDKAGAEDGVAKASLKPGAAGKTKVSVSAKGANIPMPVPLSMTELFDLDTAVTVQLVNDETTTCWTSEFTVAKTNTAEQFKASAP